jgi:hypothetical protein
VAARVPSSRSVPSRVVNVNPNGFGLLTFVHNRIVAPPSGRLAVGRSNRISAA